MFGSVTQRRLKVACQCGQALSTNHLTRAPEAEHGVHRSLKVRAGEAQPHPFNSAGEQPDVVPDEEPPNIRVVIDPIP